MSDGTFGSCEASTAVREKPHTLDLESRLRELFAKIRHLIRSELRTSVKSKLLIPGILDTVTEVTVAFEQDKVIDVEAYLCYPTSEGPYKIFCLPRLERGLVPEGDISLATAVTILENVYISFTHPGSTIIRYDTMFDGEDFANEKTPIASIAHEKTAVAQAQ